MPEDDYDGIKCFRGIGNALLIELVVAVILGTAWSYIWNSQTIIWFF